MGAAQGPPDSAKDLESDYLPTVIDETESSSTSSHSEDVLPCCNPLENEAMERHVKRKEMNRMAAQRCRMRRKEKALRGQKEIRALESKNTELRFRVFELTQAKAQMCNVIEVHCGAAAAELASAVAS